MASSDNSTKSGSDSAETVDAAIPKTVEIASGADHQSWIQRTRTNPVSVLGRFPGQFLYSENNTNGRNARLIEHLKQILPEREIILWSGGFNPMIGAGGSDPVVNTGGGAAGCSLLGIICTALGIVGLVVQPFVAILLLIAGFALMRQGRRPEPLEADEVFYALTNRNLKIFVDSAIFRHSNSNSSGSYHWDTFVIDVAFDEIEEARFFSKTESLSQRVELEVKLPQSAEHGTLWLKGFSKSERSSLLEHLRKLNVQCQEQTEPGKS